MAYGRTWNVISSSHFLRGNMTYNLREASVRVVHLSPIHITAALAISGGKFYPILPLKLPFSPNPPAGPPLLAVLPLVPL